MKKNITNPLGIISLFLSFIYGMASMILTIGNLPECLKSALIIFIIIFPIIVFITFVWLVVKHHVKLYGPADYSDSKYFIEALGIFNSAEIKNDFKQIEKETKEIVIKQSQSQTADTSEIKRLLTLQYSINWKKNYNQLKNDFNKINSFDDILYNPQTCGKSFKILMKIIDEISVGFNSKKLNTDIFNIYLKDDFILVWNKISNIVYDIRNIGKMYGAYSDFEKVIKTIRQ